MIFYHVVSDKPKYVGQHFVINKERPNEDENEPIVEVLVDGEIEVVEIMKEVNANI